MEFKFSTDVELKEAMKNLSLYERNGTNFYSRVVCSKREHGEREDIERPRPYIEKELTLNGYVSKEGLIEFILIIHVKDFNVFGNIKFFKLNTMNLKRAVAIFNKIKSIDDDFEKLQSEVE